MSDGLPSDEQLQRMERAVMARIRRRAELPKRIATSAAVAALVAGGVFLLPRVGLSGGGGAGSSSSGGGGSTAYRGESDSSGSSAGGSSALLAACHATATTTAGELRVPITADTAAAAIDACLVALEKGQVPGPSADAPNDLKTEPITAKDLVVCRDDAGRLQVFVKDAHPSTLCARNGLKAP